MSKVKGGQVFVEIGADSKRFFKALSDVQRGIGKLGRSVSAAGSKLAGMGAAALLPFGAAIRQGTAYESTLLNIQASTGATAAELDKIRSAGMQVSQALGVGPTEATQGFLELLKAGMSVDEVLAGAGKTALEFAKVGNMDVAAASVVMADAMKVFGVSADTAANTLSAAADASSTSIEAMTLAFSQSSAVAALANQSMGDLSAALAILANNGVKGSDAGTSVKTMLMRLMAPADDAADALQQVGLSVQSFRNADGTIKPLVEILGTLNGAFAGIDQAAKDDIFRRIFGQDAIRAAAILTRTGVDGFNKMRGAMGGAMSVGDKYKTLMSGLAGAGQKLLAALQRVAIAMSDAIGPAVTDIASAIAPVIDGFQKFVTENKDVVAQVAKFAVAAVGLGGVLVTLGTSLQLTAFAFGGVGNAVLLATAPLRVMVGAAAMIGASFASSVPGVFALAGAVGSSMAKATTAVAVFATQSTASIAGFAASSALSLAAFGASAVRSVAGYSSALAGVFSSQFKIARFLGGSFIGSASIAFSKMAMSIGGVRSAVTALGPALAFVSRGVISLASDVGRLAAPLARPFIETGLAVSTFAANAARNVAAYVGSIATAVASTVSGAASMAAAWVGNVLKAIGTFAAGAATSIGKYLASIGLAVSSTIAAAAGIAGAWLATAFPATAAFVSQAAARLAAYVTATTAALASSIASAVGIAGAWIASGMPGLVTFVTTAVGGLATYIGSCAAAVAASVASAAAVAAAWLAPIAPILAIGTAIAGAGALVYSFSGQIKGAFSGVGELVGQAAGAIGGKFNAAVSNGMVVLGDLTETATTTFNGIYAAIAEGDLAGAMDVLWAGLYAGWLRGVEALMGAVDPWVTMFQNAFTILGAEIYKIWDSLWTNVGATVNTAGAYLLGAFDNIINPILAAWDTLEAGIRKSWNRIQSFLKKGFDLKKENDKVDSEMAARRRQREIDRPGIEGRTDRAAQENARAEKERADRARAIDENTQATADGREAENQRRRDERRAATQAAEGAVAGASRGKRETQARNQQFTDLLKQIESASSLSALRDLYEEFDTLSQNGRLSSAQSATLETALEDAQDRLNKAGMGGASAGASASEKAAAGAGLAGADAAQSKAEVAGTFSSTNLGGMGFGSSLGERQLKALETIASNTANLDGPAYAQE